MKVSLCSHDGEGYFGGPFTWLLRLLTAFREQGLDGRALLISDHAPDRGYVWQGLHEAGIPCRALRCHSLTQLHDHTEGRGRWLLRELRRDRPDVFVTNIVAAANR